MAKQIISLVLLLVLSFSLVPSAYADSAYSFVDDRAGILSDETEQIIAVYNEDLMRSCDGARIEILTMSSIEGVDTQGITAAGHNGILLVMSVKERKAWLSVGEGLRGSFAGGEKTTYLDLYFRDDFKAGNYNAAVRKLAEQLTVWLAGHFGADHYSFAIFKEQQEKDDAKWKAVAISMAVLTAVMIGVVVWACVKHHLRLSWRLIWDILRGLFNIVRFGVSLVFDGDGGDIDVFGSTSGSGSGHGGGGGMGGGGGRM